MGFSCSAEASKVLNRFMDLCVAQSGSQNVFEANGRLYFLEESRREDDEGSIRGSINAFYADASALVPLSLAAYKASKDGRFYSKKAGSFKIDGYGRVVRGPAALKAIGRNKELDAQVAKNKADFERDLAEAASLGISVPDLLARRAA